jgi:spore maturation protein CgeB
MSERALKIRLFYHSIIADWNNGHAHFLRGFASELAARGHEVVVLEPRDGWSYQNQIKDSGANPEEWFRAKFPDLRVVRYNGDLDLAAALENADLAIVHEWNPPELIAALGAARARDGARLRLLFHDTHHRAVTDPAAMRQFDLSAFDGVLAFGEVLRDLYEREGWAPRAWVWHEAADTRQFQPRRAGEKALDLVWVGNWGDDERSEELREFLIEPVRKLGLRAAIYGVRYPAHALAALREAGIAYMGWLPNHLVPEIFAQARLTVHVPRRPYARHLPGIPTIRPFEAMACGLPLISGPWDDSEQLFEVGRDFLMARDGAEMTELLRAVLADETLARSLSERGAAAIQRRHSCADRVDELLAIHGEIA